MLESRLMRLPSGSYNASTGSYSVSSRLDILDAFCRRNNLTLVLISVVLGFIFPGPGQILKGLNFFQHQAYGIDFSFNFVTCMLFVLMLSSAPRCSARDFRNLLETPKTFAISLVSIYILVPMVALAASALLVAVLPRDVGLQLAIGVMLIAAAPVTVTTVYWLTLSRGNLPLATALFTVTSALAPLTMPALLRLMLSVSTIKVLLPYGSAIGVLILSVWLPLALALLLRKVAPSVIERSKTVLSLVSVLSLLITLFIIAASSADLMKEKLTVATFLVTVAVVLGASAINFTWGFVVGGLFGLPRIDKVTVTFLSPMRSNGMAMAVALSAFGADYPLAVIPAGIAVLQHIPAKLAHWWLINVKKVALREYERHYITGLLAQYYYKPFSILPRPAAEEYEIHQAVVDNIDEEGVCIVGDHAIPVGEIVNLTLYQDWSDVPPVQAKAVSVWNQAVVEGENQYIGGLRFINLRKDWPGRFAAFVKDSKSKEAPADGTGTNS